MTLRSPFLRAITNSLRFPMTPYYILAYGRREAPSGERLVRSLLRDAEVSPDVR